MQGKVTLTVSTKHDASKIEASQLFCVILACLHRHCHSGFFFSLKQLASSLCPCLLVPPTCEDQMWLYQMAHHLDYLNFCLFDREFLVHFLPNPTIHVSGSCACGWGLNLSQFHPSFYFGLGGGKGLSVLYRELLSALVVGHYLSCIRLCPLTSVSLCTVGAYLLV